ncbi:MAG: hypothetical protein QXZ24_05255, partial [Candidatus Jordarchaeales archaeon]
FSKEEEEIKEIKKELSIPICGGLFLFPVFVGDAPPVLEEIFQSPFVGDCFCFLVFFCLFFVF